MNNNTAENALQITAAKGSEVMITTGGVELNSLAAVMAYSNLISRSGLVPKDDVGKPEKLAGKILRGIELNVAPFTAIYNIAMINNMPCSFGDLPMSMCLRSGLLEDVKFEQIGEPGKDTQGYKVTVKRKGIPTKFISIFTLADGKKAGLMGKDNWSKYPVRMCLNRARAFCLRDAFPDVLQGMYTKEEAEEIAVEADFHVVENEPEPEPFQNNDPGIVFTPEDDTNLPPEPIVDTDTGEVTEEDGEKETNMFGDL